MSKDLEKLENKITELMDISNIMDLQHHNIFMLFTDIGTSISKIKQTLEEKDLVIERYRKQNKYEANKNIY